MARENKRKRDERRFGKPDRLADRLRSADWKQLAAPSWANAGDRLHVARFASEQLNMICGLLDDACRVVCGDNVADYYYAQTAQEMWYWREDFPNCRPPFDLCFVEFNRPEAFRDTTGVRAFDPSFPIQWGWVIETLDATKLPRVSAQHGVTRELTSLLDLPGVAFVLRCTSVLTQFDLIVPGFQAYYLPIDLNGSILAEPIILSAFGLGLGRDDEMLREKCQFLHTALLAIAFMNCKNVSLEAVEPDPRVNRDRRRNGMKPFLRYHTINIEPMKQVLRIEGRIESVGLKKALHICRGHFSTYTAERPLFGKVAGTFWIPAHVRGSVKQGVVISDYDVKAPRS